MAFTSTTQSQTYTIGDKFAIDFQGTAGASGNTISNVNFIVDTVLGGPEDTAFSQSGGTVTVTGLTNTKAETLLLRGRTTL